MMDFPAFRTKKEEGEKYEEGKTLMRLQLQAAGEKPGTKEGEVDTFINNGRRNKTSRSSGAYTIYKYIVKLGLVIVQEI